MTASDVRLEGNQVTHTNPKNASGDTVSFDFDFLAPNSCRTTKITAWGNIVTSDFNPKSLDYPFARRT